jgi:hypothetical protein
MAYDEDEFLEDDYADEELESDPDEDSSVGNYDYDDVEHISMDDLEDENEDFYEMDED